MGQNVYTALYQPLLTGPRWQFDKLLYRLSLVQVDVVLGANRLGEVWLENFS